MSWYPAEVVVFLVQSRDLGRIAAWWAEYGTQVKGGGSVATSRQFFRARSFQSMRHGVSRDRPTRLLALFPLPPIMFVGSC